MKRTPIFLMSILLITMILPLIPTSPNPTQEQLGIRDTTELPLLAATPRSNATVIKVSDDAAVSDNFPDTNYGSSALSVSNASGDIQRSWLKFNLTHLPDNLHFTRATVNLFAHSSSGSADYPMGVYFSENDTWTEESITWNNQPVYNAIPTAVIDSPASPDMFIFGNWYEWEITTDVTQTLEQDGILSLTIRLVNEDTPGNTVLGFASREYSITTSQNWIPFVSLEYAIPTTSELKVDGFSESPQIDYIQSANPEFSWNFVDGDPDDFQKNYELEVWNDTNFDDTKLMSENNTGFTVIYDTGGSTYMVPLSTNIELRFQFKWPSSMIQETGFVDKLFFEMSALTGTTTFSDLTIYMLCVDDSSALGTDFQANYDGRTPIQVLNRSSYSAITKDGFMIFDIENTFLVSSELDLLIEVRTTGLSGDLNLANITGSVGGSTAFEAGAGSYDVSTASVTTDNTHGLRLEIIGHEVYGSGGLANSYPFGISGGALERFQLKYSQGLVNREGFIDKILFPVGMAGDLVYENFELYLVETPISTYLSHTDMDSNYAGNTPTLVLSASQYVMKDMGGVLVIDVDDTFYYSNTDNLLIEMRYDSLVSGDQRALYGDLGGGYRAWSGAFPGNDSSTYNMLLEFIYDTTTVDYSGSPLVNTTTYYWRARTCDSLGIWSDWETGSFTYSVLTSLPNWSGLTESADPIEFGGEVTVSIIVTHTTEIKQVLLDYEGTNHTMTQIVDTFSLTWTPSSTGVNDYTIYMEAYSGIWSTTSGSISVEDTTSPNWVVTPYNQVIEHGEAFSYQLDATDLSGLDTWFLNDTANFSMVDGLITNSTNLEWGSYPLSVSVNDTEGNTLTAAFKVYVFPPSTTPTTTTTTTTTTTSTTTTTTTTDTDTTETTTTATLPIDDNIMIIAALIGVVGLLLIVIVVQYRRS